MPEKKNFPPSLRVSDFVYDLPEDRIAYQPQEQRAQSRLLVYKQGHIQHQAFQELASHVPAPSHIVFNNTRVVPARLFLERDTGAKIEIFWLKALSVPHAELVFQAQGAIAGECMVGNRKRWKAGEVLQKQLTYQGRLIRLEAHWLDRDKNHVSFRWEPAEMHFSEVLELLGNIPLPPYIKRDVQEADRAQYQTVYAQKEGAVAAPTAGLHFNEKVLQELDNKGIRRSEITLHVGAGTFQPMQSEEVAQHQMHEEELLIPREVLWKLSREPQKLIAVGTTSLRALESIYWLGYKLLQGELDVEALRQFRIPQNWPYQGYIEESLPRWQLSYEALAQGLDEIGESYLRGNTQLFIVPGYTFRATRGIITNFHLPKSTLLLLIGALIGQDWKKVYQEALAKGYRFLSYGDSSLLIP